MIQADLSNLFMNWFGYKTLVKMKLAITIFSDHYSNIVITSFNSYED